MSSRNSVLCNAINDKKRKINHLSKKGITENLPGMESFLRPKDMRFIFLNSPQFFYIVFKLLYIKSYKKGHALVEASL
jgi:hypothetical protein